MVLQRAPAIAVLWGQTQAGAVVHTRFDGEDFVAVADANGTWRQSLPPQNATAMGRSILINSSSGDAAALEDVLFGDVYLCGGQSNMEYALPATTNTTIEADWANGHPELRIFSVGHATQSAVPLLDLQTVWHSWQVASNLTVREDYGPGHTLFSTFSSVCWLFGKRLSQELATEGAPLPLGLISNNWGGTRLEVWTPEPAYAACGRAAETPPMYNAMIYPYTVGPIALSGVLWYQGEANVQDDGSAAAADAYACLFPQMITAWRAALHAPTLFFGFAQLSTWCAAGSNVSIAEMRDAQLAAAALPAVGWATNADFGFGCNIHPPAKQHVARRLADSALSIAYGRDVPWRSPRYLGATQAAAAENGAARVIVRLSDVSTPGLTTDVYPHNYDLDASLRGLAAPSSPPLPPLNCSDASTVPPGSCAWAAIEFGDRGWVNATVSAHLGQLVLEAVPPSGGPPAAASPLATRSAYGWGPIPLLTAYDRGTALPVLPWNRSLG